jgi:L,D-transpeptidase catalytic domain
MTDGYRMASPRSPLALRASWVATALASLLAVGPVATSWSADRAPAMQTLMAGLAVGAPPRTPAALAIRDDRIARPAISTADRKEELAPEPTLLVHVPAGLVARARPWSSAPSLGTVASVSRYYHVPIVLAVEARSANGRWGRVELPYLFPRRDGWIRLGALHTETTWVRVDVDLSSHTVRVFKRDELRYTVKGATGAPSSPTPPGSYVVTDRVPFAVGGPLGSFAFGISGIQPRLPAGWSGGDQLAIHGTNSPSTIGRSASAGCVRVSEWALDRFRPLLRLGTPVVIHL